MDRDSGANLILVKTALDKLRDDQLQNEAREGKATALDEVIFTQDEADKAAVVTSVIGGGGYFDKSTDDQAPKKGVQKRAVSPKTTQIAEFNQNLAITRTFMADQQHSAVSKAVRQATKAWVASRDRNAFSVYSGGFATTTTTDGAYLFSNSHVSVNGDTVDNLETGVFNDDNLNTLVTSLRLQVDNSGVIVGYEPDFALVPAALHKTATAVTKSVLRAGNGNNDMNYWSDYYPGMKVLYSPHLDGVSTTAYFVGAKGHDVMRFEREAFFTNLVPWETDPNDNYVYKLRAREEVDAITYVGVAASNGTV